MEIVEIIAISVAFLGVIFAGISLLLTRRQIQLDQKMRTMDYATSQFDKLTELGARQDLREMKIQNQDIMTYTEDNPEKLQRLLEYVYTFNRIGAGIRKKALSEDVIFNIWTPKWFEGHWQTFEPLIRNERERRGEEASGAYVFFEWLATKKCPQVRKKYPESPLKSSKKKLQTESQREA